MNQIALYLSKAASKGLQGALTADMVQSAITEVCGVKVPMNNLVVRGGEVTVKADSVLKSKILIHQRKLLLFLTERLPGKIQSIR